IPLRPFVEGLELGVQPAGGDFVLPLEGGHTTVVKRHPVARVLESRPDGVLDSASLAASARFVAWAVSFSGEKCSQNTTATPALTEPVGPILCMAFETGVSEWKIAFSTWLGQRPRRHTLAARTW